MATHKSDAMRQAEFMVAAEAMYVRLRAWRGEHPDASFDEIGEQVTRERKALMAQLLGELAMQPEEVTSLAPALCPECGQPLRDKGKRSRSVSHLEGDVEIERTYHSCGSCHRSFFPLGHQTETDCAWVESTDD